MATELHISKDTQESHSFVRGADNALRPVISLADGALTQFTSGSGYQSVTLASGAASGLTVPVGATQALIRVETTNCRWRDDGTAPTATAGMLMTTTDAPLTFVEDLTKLKFISTGAAGAIDVVYYIG